MLIKAALHIWFRVCLCGLFCVCLRVMEWHIYLVLKVIADFTHLGGSHNTLAKAVQQHSPLVYCHKDPEILPEPHHFPLATLAMLKRWDCPSSSVIILGHLQSYYDRLNVDAVCCVSNQLSVWLIWHRSCMIASKQLGKTTKLCSWFEAARWNHRTHFANHSVSSATSSSCLEPAFHLLRQSSLSKSSTLNTLVRSVEWFEAARWTHQTHFLLQQVSLMTSSRCFDPASVMKSSNSITHVGSVDFSKAAWWNHQTHSSIHWVSLITSSSCSDPVSVVQSSNPNTLVGLSECFEAAWWNHQTRFFTQQVSFMTSSSCFESATHCLDRSSLMR
jgi:hypothetical protein